MSRSLDAILLEILQTCGAVKRRIVGFHAARHGFTKEQCDEALQRLRAAKKVKLRRRQGGAHYAPWPSR